MRSINSFPFSTYLRAHEQDQQRKLRGEPNSNVRLRVNQLQAYIPPLKIFGIRNLNRPQQRGGYSDDLVNAIFIVDSDLERC